MVALVTPPAPVESGVAARSGASRRLATGAVLLALIVAAFEGTVVTSAMPTIVGALGGLGIYAWVFSAFLLASTVGVLTSGKLADAFGRRPVFVAGVGLFLLGSALCGASRSIHQLIAFRIVQGLGAGAIQPIAMTITADLYNLRERARIQGVLTTAWGGANVLGPIIGGWIVMHTSWRWVFLVNVPFGLLAVLILMMTYRDPPRAPSSKQATSPTAGVLGALLAGMVAALLLFALEPGGGLGMRIRIGAVVLSLVAAFALVRHQRRTASPILPPSLFPDPVVRAGLLGGLFAGGVLYTCSAYVPLWMMARLSTSAVTAGAALVPLLAGWALGSSFGVTVLVRWGMKTSVAGGFAIATLGAVALAWSAMAALPAPFVFAALGLLGFGLGPAASTSLVAPQSHVAWRHRGMMTSSVYATRMLGGSLSVAALGSTSAAASLRFLGVAGIAVTALLVMAGIAPRQVGEADLD
ncbi:drug resistance transporter, EmrB/QacA family protein [Minicystis rosea]|nr:drug resistance transporter, EmrB/QacA family protein [Minicystis rosea]